VGTPSQTVDFLRTAPRHEWAAKRFITKAIHRHGVPEKVTMTGLTTSGNRPH
jgi:transposase-like protein